MWLESRSQDSPLVIPRGHSCTQCFIQGRTNETGINSWHLPSCFPTEMQKFVEVSKTEPMWDSLPGNFWEWRNVLVFSQDFGRSPRMSENSTLFSQRRRSYSVVSDLMKTQVASAELKEFLSLLSFKVSVGLELPFRTRDKLQEAFS